MKETDELARAIRRVSARYRGAPLNDRCYVASKLRIDPVLRAVARLGDLGTVVDAGAGRGQLSLALLELGRVSSLQGFDFDERKVLLANRAANGDARFAVADLRSAEIPKADTILLVDVLHYLPVEDQNAVLARCRAALEVGGRLVVREVDTKRSAASWFSRALEWIVTRLGYNRAAGKLTFCSSEELVARFRAHGFACQDEDAGQGTPFENRLIVGTVEPASGA